MNIDKYKDGSEYVDPDGCSWSDAEDFIQGYQLGFCCCGQPWLTLAYIRDAMILLKNRRATSADKLPSKEEFKDIWEKWGKDCKELFKTDEAAWLMWYFLDSKNLTEHGGNCSGAWLSEKGEKMLEDLIELYPLEIKE